MRRRTDLIAIGPGVKLSGFELKARRMRLAEFKGRLVNAVTREPLISGEVELEPESQGTPGEAFERRTVKGKAAEFAFPFVQPGRYLL